MAERRAFRPVLGISACNRSFGEEAAQVVINRYVEAAMRHADVAALIIPALPDLMNADEVAGRIDGLLLTGSPSNVDPALYGESDGDGPFDPDRDRMVFGLVSAMAVRGKPVFGICRGIQEINVARGGTLARDLAADDRPLSHHSEERVAIAPMFAHRHEVDFVRGGLLERSFGREHLTVNSVHYQGIKTLGEGLTAEATSADGVTEAVSGRSGSAPLLAVQWHPEWDADTDRFSAAFFQLLGRALRGDPLTSPSGECN